MNMNMYSPIVLSVQKSTLGLKICKTFRTLPGILNLPDNHKLHVNAFMDNTLLTPIKVTVLMLKVTS